MEVLIQSVQGSADAPSALGFLFGKKPTTEKVIQYVDTYKQKAPAQRLHKYILHANLKDILKKDPGQIAQTLSSRPVSRDTSRVQQLVMSVCFTIHPITFSFFSFFSSFLLFFTRLGHSICGHLLQRKQPPIIVI